MRILGVVHRWLGTSPELYYQVTIPLEGRTGCQFIIGIDAILQQQHNQNGIPFLIRYYQPIRPALRKFLLLGAVLPKTGFVIMISGFFVAGCMSDFRRSFVVE